MDRFDVQKLREERDAARAAVIAINDVLFTLETEFKRQLEDMRQMVEQIAKTGGGDA